MGPALGVREAGRGRRCPRSSSPIGRRTPIDRFVLARLEKEGLKPSPEADKYTLARRVALDLTGLPPDPELVKRFVADSSPEAYEQLVDELLKSPAYGERWARMWLDLARYADTKGYDKDLGRTIWRYRDWVIDAFNRDLPYDQFTLDQLAGDLLPEPTADQLLATAFHRNTMTNDEGGTDDEEFRVAAVKDRVDTTFQVWMGLTMGCAKCHSHKYDPITQKEYYQLYAFFNQTEDADAGDERPKLPTPTKAQQEQIAKLQAEYMQVRQRVYTYTDEFKAAAAKWEVRRSKQAGWTVAKPTDDDRRQRQHDEAASTTARSWSQARRPARETYTVTFPAGTKPITGHPAGSAAGQVAPAAAASAGRRTTATSSCQPLRGEGEGEGRDGHGTGDRLGDGGLLAGPVPGRARDQEPGPEEARLGGRPEAARHPPGGVRPGRAVHAGRGTELEVTLDHQFEFNYPGFSIGRFRLFLTGRRRRRSAANCRPSCAASSCSRRNGGRRSSRRTCWAYYAGIAADDEAAPRQARRAAEADRGGPGPADADHAELPPDKRRPTQGPRSRQLPRPGRGGRAGGAGGVPPVPGRRAAEPARAWPRGSCIRTTR